MKTSVAVRVIMVLGLIVLTASAALAAGPNGPTSLTGTVLSPTAIELKWTDNYPDETYFRIERTPNGVSFTELVTDLTVTSFVDSTVTTDVLYYYRVYAVNAAGDSNPSNVISKFTQDTIAPPAPIPTTPPMGDQLDTHNVQFQWNSVSDMSGVTYQIVVNDLANGITLHDVSGITSTNISLLLYDSNYEWYVIAKDGAGNVGPASGLYYCLVAATDPMAPDTTVTAPNGGEVLVVGASYAITWYTLDQDFTSTPDLKIRIFFSYNNGGSWEQIASLGNNPGAFNWIVPNVLCEESCLIRVTAENMAQMVGSDDSDFAFSIIAASSGGDPVAADTNPPGGGTVATDTNPPNKAPFAPVLVFPADGQGGLGTDITCRWKKSQDLDGDAVTYRVHYCLNQDFSNCTPYTVAVNGAPKAFFTYAGLPGLMLIGAIFAVPLSGRKKFMLLMISVIIIGGGVVACSGGGSDGDVAPAASDELSLQMSGLKAGATYYWKVVADDGKGGTAESAIWSFTAQ